MDSSWKAGLGHAGDSGSGGGQQPGPRAQRPLRSHRLEQTGDPGKDVNELGAKPNRVALPGREARRIQQSPLAGSTYTHRAVSEVGVGCGAASRHDVCDCAPWLTIRLTAARPRPGRCIGDWQRCSRFPGRAYMMAEAPLPYPAELSGHAWVGWSMRRVFVGQPSIDTKMAAAS